MKSLIHGFLVLSLCATHSLLFANSVDCGPDIDVMNTTGSCDAFVTITNPVSTDAACVITSVVNDYNGLNNASDTYPVGTTEVIFTINFSNGSTAQCSIDVTVQDNESPSLNCPVVSDVCDLSANPVYATLAEYLAAGGVATDNCGLVPASFMLESETIDPPGTCDRTVTRVYSILDTDGNLSTCNQDFVFTDDATPPVVTCPANLTLSADDNCLATASIPPVVADDCAIDDINYSITGVFLNSGINDASSVEFELGLSTITYTATDDCGNVGSCSFTILVEDNTAPVFDTDPMDIPDIACTDPMPAQEALTATDNCEAALIITQDQLMSGNSCTGQTITYTWSVSDGSNVSNTSTSFMILPDMEAPVLDAAPSTPTDIACDADFPAPDVLTASDGCSTATVQVDTLPFVEDFCAGFDVVYRYTPIDACGNMGVPADVTFSVLPDMTPPVVDPLLALEFDNDTGECFAELSGVLPFPTATDDCSGVATATFVRMDTGDADTEFPVGTTTLTWTVTDACGFSTMVNQDITVVDAEGPSLSCNGAPLVVALDGNGEGKITEDQIILSSSDNCGMIVSEQIQRMEDNCGNPDDLLLGDCVAVCCDDVGTIMIQGVVMDDSGMTTSCMVPVVIQDNLGPVVTCPSNIAISCNFDFSTDDLTVFGSIETDGSTPDDIVVMDELYDPTFVAGTNGTATDNCGVATITEAFVDNRDNCGEGNILRTFTVTDVNGNTSQCTQTINVTNTDPFDGSEITWPDPTVELNDCTNFDLDPSNTGSPQVTPVNCVNLMQTYEDTVYDTPNSGCITVERDWTIIDWCQYDPNDPMSGGRYEFSQVIQVIDDVDPVFADSPSEVDVCFNNGSCTEGNANQSVSVSDNCTAQDDLLVTYSVDYNADGSIDVIGVGTTFNDPIPAGRHTITWIADDRCGNEGMLTYALNVIDCKPPTPVCLNGLSININQMPGMEPMVTIWASDFDASSYDNCTPQSELIYSFSSDVTDTNITFMCDDLGIQSIQMWVTDGWGNQAFCETFIDVQDNFDVCPETTMLRLGGEITREDGISLQEAEITLSYDSASHTSMTDEAGHYLFESLPMYANYEVMPKYESDYGLGVSTLDIILIQRHLLTLESLSTPYQLIAADVNNSESITAADLVDIRKLILEITDSFEQSDSWKFVDKKTVFSDANHPWPYAEGMYMYDLDHSVMNSDFIAMKSGDVNNSASLNATTENVDSRTSPLQLSKRLSANNHLEFVLNTDVDLLGFQIQLRAMDDAATLPSLSSALLGIMPEHYHLDKENATVSISWNTAQALSLESGDVLFSFDSDTDWELTTEAFDHESYADDLTVNAITLDQITTIGEVTSDDLFVKSVPNPFTHETQLYFDLQSAGEVTILVHNEIGELVYGTRVLMDKGSQTFTLSADDLEHTDGLYFCTLITEHQRTTEKLFLVR